MTYPAGKSRSGYDRAEFRDGILVPVALLDDGLNKACRSRVDRDAACRFDVVDNRFLFAVH